MNRIDSSGNIESWLSFGTNSTYDKAASSISRSGSSYKFGANPSIKRIYQNFNLPNESEETTYIASGWVHGKGARIRDNVETSIKILVYYSDGTSKWIEPKYTYNQALFGWQYGVLTFSLDDGSTTDKLATKMSICYTSYGQVNDIYYDNLQLVKQKVYIDAYDDKGNLTKSEGGIYEYNESNDIERIIDKKDEITLYTYDSKHNLISSISPYGLKSTFTYDDAGNQLTSQVASEDDEIIKTSDEYDTSKSYKTISYDSDGHATHYEYNKAKGLLTKISQNTGASSSNDITYTYDASDDSLKSVSSGGISKSYTYDYKDRLTAITHNGFNYNYSYDAYNNLINIKIGNNTIKTHTYEANNGNLSTTSYANGYNELYEYDEYGQIRQVKSNGQLMIGNVYDTLGNVIICYDYKGLEEYHYDYDLEGKLIRSYVCDYATKQKKFTYEYGYDDADRIKYEISIIDGRTNKKQYHYGQENSVDAITVNGDGILSFTYDSLLRTKSRNLVFGSGTNKSYITTNYTYKASDNRSGMTTTEIASENIDGLNYAYSYDFVGNITKITRTRNGTNKTVDYFYDSNNQLIRENNQITSQTIAYEYDSGGNLKSEKIYNYTSDSLTNKTASITNTYTYGNSDC